MPSQVASRDARSCAWLGQVLRFGAVGTIATALHASVAYAYLIAGHDSALAANLLGFLASFTWSFAGNAYWVFHFNGSLLKVFPRFLAFSICGLALATAISFASDACGLNPYWALCLVVLTIPTFSYFANRLIVFR